MRSRSALLLLILAAGGIALDAAPAHAQAAYFARPEDCLPVVHQQIDRLGLKDVRGIDLSRRLSPGGGFHGDDTRIVGFDAWVRLERCQGAVVVDMTPECWVRQVYTRYHCNIDGLPHFN